MAVGPRSAVRHCLNVAGLRGVDWGRACCFKHNVLKRRKPFNQAICVASASSCFANVAAVPTASVTGCAALRITDGLHMM